MELYWYQSEAVAAVYKYLHEKAGNPVVVLPTGAGKSLVIARLVADLVTNWNGRALVLAHVKELLEQNAAELQALCPLVLVGLYSAGLKKRDTDSQVVVAGIQSAYDKAEELGRFDLVVIDEAHLIPESGDGMYRQLVRALTEINPDVRVIGLTATPYRTGTGDLCSPDGVLNDVCYSVGVRPLIAQGHLSRLIGRRAWSEVDTAGLHVRAGEYVDGEVEARMLAEGVVERAAAEIVTQCADRKSCLVFCQTVAHARQVADALFHATSATVVRARAQLAPARQGEDGSGFELDEVAPEQSPVVPVAADWLEEQGLPVDAVRRWLDHGTETVRLITGDTPADERAEAIDEFRAGRVKYLVNVNVLTTGFNARNVDCVAILRATLSPGLFYQMVGRGFRLHDGKENCLILDFGQNIRRHGPVDDIRPRGSRKSGGPRDGEAPVTKECPECRAVVSPTVTTCPGCGYAWPVEVRQPAHDGTADGEPLSTGVTTESKPVTGVEYRVHTKKDAPPEAPKTLRVTYKTGFAEYVSEWVCVEHPAGGFAHRKAEAWWRKRCRAPMPATAAEAVVYALHGLLAVPTEIRVKVKKGEKYPEIVGATLGAIPDGGWACPECGDGETVLDRHPADRFYPGRVACGSCNHTVGLVHQDVVTVVGFFDPDDPRPLLPAGVTAVYDRDESDAPRDSDDTRSSFDLLAAVESAGTDDDLPF